MKWLNSAWAFTLYIGVMFVAYILAGIFPSLPYAIFSVQMTTGVVGYWMKRNAREKNGGNGNGNGNGNASGN
jgi:hypothetical protein